MSVAAVVISSVGVAVVVTVVAATVHRQLLSTQCGLCWIVVELCFGGGIYTETDANTSCIAKYHCINVPPTCSKWI